MLQKLVDLGLFSATCCVLLVTILPVLKTHRWWVRGWDFPRVQILIIAIVLLIATAVWLSQWRLPVMIGLAVVALHQGTRIFPFTPLARAELRLAPARDAPSQLTLLSANVEMTNTRHAAIGALIDDEDPDVVFLMETDSTWLAALEPHLARYPHVVREPRDNFYGMIFATRLPVEQARIVYLTPDDTPSLFAELRAPNGQLFRVIGLHPRPPVPGNTTEDRDAQMLYAARFARKADVPLVAMGDFNDAAWSDTSRRFKQVGGYLDPRIGRGLVASFDANSRLLRVPIDQFLVTEEIAVVDFRRGPANGSDHFPLIARIDTDAQIARQHNTAPAKISPERADELQLIYDRYRQDVGRDPLD